MKENYLSNFDEEKKVNFIREKLQHLQEKRILIYGTGVIAARVIKALDNSNIVGVVDKLKFCGKLEGKPIVLWDEISQEDHIDSVIIASSSKYYEEIYSRIMVKCITYGIDVFGANGKKMGCKFPWEMRSVEDSKYYKKNKEELKKKIQQYDAISFDLFDTLIMRKTLEPTDVFDIVENRINKKGFNIKDFKKKRRHAELQSGIGNIHSIYDNLQDLLDITDEEKKQILYEEINCEIDCLIPRKVMVDIMKYAINIGKKVSIISDMYLTTEILTDILDKLGIMGYEKLYISCEYKVGKGNGLFEVYKNEVQSKKYLHIGDNVKADIISAENAGIDAYFIRSAYEMLQTSASRDILAWANNCNEKSIVGLAISDLLNDPFAMYQSCGFISIKTRGQFGKMFIAPVIISYIQRLTEWINKNNYEGVLLVARDGYLLKSLLECYKQYNKLEDIPIYYFLTSRKLALCSTLETEKDIRKLASYYNSVDVVIDFLKSVLNEREVLSLRTDLYDSIEEYLLAHKDALIVKSSQIRFNYLKYIVAQGINLNGKYLLCDLNSSGTVHECLNKIFGQPLDGFYLHRIIGSIVREVTVNSIYNEINVEDLRNNIALYTNLLEFVLTAPYPSIMSMDSSGHPIYAKDVRTEQQLSIMMDMQDKLERVFKEYMELLYIPELEVCKELPDVMLGNCKKVEYEGECRDIENLYLYDDMGGRNFSILG